MKIASRTQFHIERRRRGLLRDCEIFGNIRITFVSSCTRHSLGIHREEFLLCNDDQNPGLLKLILHILTLDHGPGALCSVAGKCVFVVSCQCRHLIRHASDVWHCWAMDFHWPAITELSIVKIFADKCSYFEWCRQFVKTPDYNKHCRTSPTCVQLIRRLGGGGGVLDKHVSSLIILGSCHPSPVTRQHGLLAQRAHEQTTAGKVILYSCYLLQSYIDSSLYLIKGWKQKTNNLRTFLIIHFPHILSFPTW